METSPPNLHDLYACGTVEGIAFWCSNHACQHHDSAPVGVLEIDYGVTDDAAGHGAPQLLPQALWPGAGPARVEIVDCVLQFDCLHVSRHTTERGHSGEWDVGIYNHLCQGVVELSWEDGVGELCTLSWSGLYVLLSVAALLTAGIFLLFTLVNLLTKIRRGQPVWKTITFSLDEEKFDDDYLHLRTSDMTAAGAKKGDYIRITLKPKWYQISPTTFGAAAHNHHRNVGKDQIYLPSSLFDKLGGDEGSTEATRRARLYKISKYPLAGLWNHPDFGIRISFRLTTMATIFSLITGILVADFFASRVEASDMSIRPVRLGPDHFQNGEVFHGRATEITDGDTLVINVSKDKVPFLLVTRLWGIDALELKQNCLVEGVPVPCGETARAELARLVMGKDLTCMKVKPFFEKVMARCSTSPFDLQSEMVARGFAFDCPKFSGGKFVREETEASDGKQGAWAGSFRMPWEDRGSPDACGR